MMNPTKTNNTFLSYFVLFVWVFLSMGVGLGRSQTSEIKVGVVLDLDTAFSKICLTLMNMSLSDFYKEHPNYRTRLALHVRDSMKDTVQASAAALDLIQNEQVRAIIGPINSMQAQFMIRLANKTRVPTITFSASSPLLRSIKSPYFVRATVDDSFQVNAIAAIVESFGWRRVDAIYMDNELGEGIMPYLSDALQDVQVDKSVISPEANDDQILKELYKLMTKQTRVFIVHMDSRLALRLFQKAREIGMMAEGYVWLMTNGMTHRMRHIDHGRSLNAIDGVLGVRSYVPKSKKLEDFRLRWKKRFEKENQSMRYDVNVFALWAYDSITALAMAVENTTLKDLQYDNVNTSTNNMTDLGSVRVSRYGPSLQKALSEVNFKGLAGEFNLTDGQLESPKFEIINFVGNKERIIGFWTPSNERFNANSNKTTLLGPVIWPGNSMVVPKGWEIPTNEKKLKVGVPVKKGFFNFVEVTRDPITNITTAKGYAIDIFEAALKKLPYAVIPQYYRCESPDDDYNDMVDQVYDGTLDALVGDVTITAHRSMHVDFTLPYTESGVSMMVPVRDNENKNTWVFLQPWNLDLWVTTGCFFVLIGFVVWLFEHRVNSDFRGPPHHQIGTSFWFSFSTMVFAHREKVVSNLARFVVVVWCFVVFVLTQSYTANLTSFLTVQRFQPAVTSMNNLIKNGDYVGYQHGAFVKDLLIKEGFHASRLVAFGSSEDCNAFLSNRSIAAVFDEVPYLKAILSQKCTKYAMVEPTFKTAGFGFAFPKNSPLTGDVSRAILDVTQGDEMLHIENKWSMKQNDCLDRNTDLSSNSLGLSSFWGLFLIAGIASFLAILTFVGLFLYENRHTLFDDSEASIWEKLTSLFRIFNEKDEKSHTFRNSAVHNVSSPMTQYTPSPSAMQIAPWPQSSSQNREFELRRMSFSPNEEGFITQTIHHEDEASIIECRIEQ
ncbi:PREDICTED: glutamate receptor 2.8-like [Camelina sativa]|uniref:Glutamate receptor n=1 Tax=Camelina sativa TaxID=90675 RepID=A0ABM0WEN1_CAMSA|nr:PREDICTED: glutamate receptor 2.8-like [Camelina sativa]